MSLPAGAAYEDGDEQGGSPPADAAILPIVSGPFAALLRSVRPVDPDVVVRGLLARKTHAHASPASGGLRVVGRARRPLRLSGSDAVTWSEAVRLSTDPLAPLRTSEAAVALPPGSTIEARVLARARTVADEEDLLTLLPVVLRIEPLLAARLPDELTNLPHTNVYLVLGRYVGGRSFGTISGPLYLESARMVDDVDYTSKRSRR